MQPSIMKKRSSKKKSVSRSNFYLDKTAIQQCEESLKIARKGGYKKEETQAYLGIGKIYRSENQNQMAFQYHEKALEFAREHGYNNLESQAHLELGQDYRADNQFHMAIQHYEKALIKIANEKGCEKEKIQAHNELAKLYRLTNQIKMAIKNYEEVLRIAGEQELKNEETQAHIELGDTFRFDNQNEKAIKHYEKALEIAGEEKKLFTTQAYLEHVYKPDKLNEMAIQHYEEVSQIARNQNCKLLETQAYLGLGEAYKSANCKKKAIECFKKARKIANEHGHEIEEIQANLSSGEAYISDNEHKKAIDCYQKALEIASTQGCKLQETTAHLLLGEAHRSCGEDQMAIKLYEKALTIAKEQEYKEREIQAHFHLGQAYKSKDNCQAACEHYQKALAIAKELDDNKFRQKAIKELSKLTERLQMSRRSYRGHGQNEEAIGNYEPAAQIANETDQNDNQAKGDPHFGNVLSGTSECEVIANHWLDYNHFQAKQHLPVEIGLGMCYASIERFKEALTCFRKALGGDHSEKASEGIINAWFRHCCRLIKSENKKATEFCESSIKIAEQFGRNYQQSCLDLALICSKNCDYDMAKEWYEKVLDILEAESNHDPLREKALGGLAVTFFSLGDTEKALETIEKAKTFAKLETRTDCNAKEETKAFCKEDPITDKWVDSFIEEACNPNRTESLPTEDLVRLGKYIEEISPSNLHTRQIAVSKPFTKEVRKAMTDNVKTSAYTSLLGKNVNELREKNEKFADSDLEIFNFAKDEVFKNASTKRPARLNETLTSYMGSIGNIQCGNAKCGTCFLVTKKEVITNYHVYRLIQKIRNGKNKENKEQNSNLPITILFDYLDCNKKEKFVEVEVDETENPCKFENPYLDYKFFRVKDDEHLRDRVPLGPMVRNWQLFDGRVVILGHPGGEEMQDEICIVVGYRKMLERIRERLRRFNGVHMTNAQLLHRTEDYQGCLSYDSTFFGGGSGSPVFDMNGNIVAMHTQGYVLETDVGNQLENVANQEHENVQNQTRKYSLMEFGVQFFSICRDIRRWHGETKVKELFPNYVLREGEEEPMDTM